MSDTPAPEVIALKARAETGGLDIEAVLRDLGIHQSTWSRWSRGKVEPRLATLRKVHAALDERLSGTA